MGLNLTKSNALWERAQPILPCFATTLSKSPTRNPPRYPKYIQRGYGARVWDVDGNEYCDFVQALGPIILGHCDRRVNDAIAAQLKDGILFSLDHPLVVEVAEMLVDMVPCAEAVRFVKTGSDAVSAAVRLARTYTGREKVAVASNAYHGWHDQLQTKEDLGKHGVPACLGDLLLTFEYNNLESVKSLFGEHDDIAAVLIEPARDFVATKEFLAGVQALCDKHGAVCIWDEIVSAFRLDRAGAQGYFGLKPHICCLGKAVANGMPLGAVVGQRDILKHFERCFVSGTYNGELLSLAASKATLTILRDEPVAEHCWAQGAKLRRAFDAVMGSLGIPATARGLDVCSRQTFHTGDAKLDKALSDLYLEESAARGVLWGSIQYLSYAHSDKDVADSIEAMGFAAEALRRFIAQPPAKPKKDSAKGA